MVAHNILSVIFLFLPAVLSMTQMAPKKSRQVKLIDYGTIKRFNKHVSRGCLKQDEEEKSVCVTGLCRLTGQTLSNI